MQNPLAALEMEPRSGELFNNCEVVGKNSGNKVQL